MTEAERGKRVPQKEATARIKIDKLQEPAGWPFFADGQSPANIRLEPSVALAPADLDALGGPSAMQFVLHDPNPEVSPGIDYASFDPDAPASSPLAVYRLLIRNVNDPLLEAFDAADPSLSTPRRNVTITPQQALALWNDTLVLRTCEHLAARPEREAHDLPSRIHLLCRLAWGRPPTTQEASTLAQHASPHGLPSACRIALNANDFLFPH